MPRDVVGVYSLPQPPFVAGTVISSAAVNSDLSDIATALTDSLARSGASPMTGTLRVPDGSSTTPSYTFTTDPTTGLAHLGAGTLAVVVSGVQLGNFTSAGWAGPVVGSGSVPIGALSDYVGTSAPTFWLLCFGQAVSRTTFAALFALIGTTFGAGNGSTTFNIPDCRDYALVGKGNMGGSDAGRLTTALFGTDPTVLGNVGGIQSKQLVTANLPPYTPAGTVAVTSNNNTYMNSPSGIVNTTTGTAGVNFAAGVFNATVVSNVVSNGSLTGTAQGGTSTAFALVQPSLIVNKIIYAGA